MKYTKEELDKLIENAPRNEKGQPIISDEDFTDNVKDLPKGTRSEDGRYANEGGYLRPGIKGDPKTYENCSKAGEASRAVYAERRKIAETIDIFLKSVDKETGKTMQEKIVEAMGIKAMEGCVGAFEALRDTVGEKPTDNVNVDVMTDGDKALMQKLLKRMGYDEGSTTE